MKYRNYDLAINPMSKARYTHECTRPGYTHGHIFQNKWDQQKASLSLPRVVSQSPPNIFRSSLRACQVRVTDEQDMMMQLRRRPMRCHVTKSTRCAERCWRNAQRGCHATSDANHSCASQSVGSTRASEGDHGRC